MKKIYVSILLLSLILCSDAFGFQLDGFSLGMSREQVSARISDLKYEKNDIGNKYLDKYFNGKDYIFIAYKKNETVEMIQFDIYDSYKYFVGSAASLGEVFGAPFSKFITNTGNGVNLKFYTENKNLGEKIQLTYDLKKNSEGEFTEKVSWVMTNDKYMK